MIENKELSERENEILKLVATGASNKDISRQLAISENTTKVHLRNIFAKLGVASRTEATLYAIREGLVIHPAATPALAQNASDSASVTASSPMPEILAPAPIAPAARAANPWQRWAIIGAVAIALVVVTSIAFSFQQQPPIASASPAPAIASATTRWKARAAMPTARANLAVAAFDNKIYAIGGEGGERASAANERYDPATDAWEQLAPKPTAVSEVGAAAIRGRVYVPGGKLENGQVTNALEAYDPNTNEWQARAAMPIGLSAYALAVHEGKLYVFGGWDGTRFIASVYEYDPEADAWRARAAMPTARGFAGAVIAGGKIFVLGGFDGKQALAVNEQYTPDRDDGSQNPWTPRRALPSPRYAMGAASIADFIYVIGGKGNEAATPNSMQYLYQSDTWNVFESAVPQVWSNAGLAAMQTNLYTVGGRLGKDLTNQNYAYQAIFTIILPPVR